MASDGYSPFKAIFCALGFYVHFFVTILGFLYPQVLSLHPGHFQSGLAFQRDCFLPLFFLMWPLATTGTKTEEDP